MRLKSYAKKILEASPPTPITRSPRTSAFRSLSATMSARRSHTRPQLLRLLTTIWSLRVVQMKRHLCSMKDEIRVSHGFTNETHSAFPPFTSGFAVEMS